jgi:hypothetical protein
MALPFIFANSAAGTQPAANLDTNFAAVALNTVIPCTASGTDAITLTPNAAAPNQAPTITSYANRMMFSFVSAGASAAAVTIRVGTLAFRPAFRLNGTTALGSGDIAAPPALYLATYSSELAGGAGGFYVTGYTLTVVPTAAALTKTDDTNVTLTLTGAPATSLLAATNIAAGWTGTLSTTKGGLGANNSAANGVPLFAAGSVTMTPTTGTGNVVLASALPVIPTVPAAGSSLPLMNGTATIGVSTAYARDDHRHPTDTTLAPLNSPSLTGTPIAPTAALGTNTTQIATTAYVHDMIFGNIRVPTNTPPLMDGPTAVVGLSLEYARADHVHPKSWVQITQAAYDALSPPNANILYVIVG